jgi:hypothetical protein
MATPVGEPDSTRTANAKTKRRDRAAHRALPPTQASTTSAARCLAASLDEASVTPTFSCQQQDADDDHPPLLIDPSTSGATLEVNLTTSNPINLDVISLASPLTIRKGNVSSIPTVIRTTAPIIGGTSPGAEPCA